MSGFVVQLVTTAQFSQQHVTSCTCVLNVASCKSSFLGHTGESPTWPGNEARNKVQKLWVFWMWTNTVWLQPLTYQSHHWHSTNN